MKSFLKRITLWTLVAVLTASGWAYAAWGDYQSRALLDEWRMAAVLCSWSG